MAETLGSLVDKLTIKNLREYHMQEMIDRNDAKFSKKELQEKLHILDSQKKELYEEIAAFVVLACKGDIPIKDEKLKLYNKREVMGNVGGIKTLAEAIEKLGQKNIELWHLEDEARREDVDLVYIGEVKRKIDVANQQRNDFIDLVDTLLGKAIAEKKA